MKSLGFLLQPPALTSAPRGLSPLAQLCSTNTINPSSGSASECLAQPGNEMPWPGMGKAGNNSRGSLGTSRFAAAPSSFRSCCWVRHRNTACAPPCSREDCHPREVPKIHLRGAQRVLLPGRTGIRLPDPNSASATGDGLEAGTIGLSWLLPRTFFSINGEHGRQGAGQFYFL